MGLRFDPVGGGQFKQAVQQIIEAESQPIKTLEARKAKEDARMKLFQEFKGKFTALDKALGEISSFHKLRELKVDLGDGANIIGVTLDKERAEPGKYKIEVGQLAAQTSWLTNGFENANDASFGMGFISVPTKDGGSESVYVDDKSSSLYGIAAAINRTQTAAVRASVIRDDTDPDTPWKLLLTAKKEGEVNQLDAPELYFMDGSSDIYIDNDNEAQNAELIIDGFPIELQSNDVPDFLMGVNLHLKQAKPDQPFTLTISEDHQKIAGKLKTLIDQMNQVLSFIVKQNTIDEKSDTSTTFAGDSTLQAIEYRLRNLLHQGFQGTNPETGESTQIFLNQVGVEFDKTGQITFKEDKFTKALESNFDLLAEGISGPNGFANQLKKSLDAYTRSMSGTLSVKEQGLRSRIRAIDDDIEKKRMLLERKKQSVVEKFSRLEATLGNLQRQQQYLSAVLPGSGGSNPISQLLGG